MSVAISDVHLRSGFTPFEVQALGAWPAIDRGAGIIRGVQVIRAGEARGHGMDVDAITVDQVVAAGNKAPRGIRSRFDHPPFGGGGFGSHVGRFTNFRKDGNVARADFHASKSAETSPSGNLIDYLFRMAEEDPDAFGVSIVFSGSKEAVDGRLVARVVELHAVDFVDSPAATDGLFAALRTEEGQTTMTAAERFDSKIKHIMASRGVNYTTAFGEVRKSHPALFEAAEGGGAPVVKRHSPEVEALNEIIAKVRLERGCSYTEALVQVRRTHPAVFEAATR